MAKFKDLHLLLQQGQKILLGDDSMPEPSNYPATSTADRGMISYTTISGYNDTGRGGTVLDIAPVDELAVTMPLAGERATEDYHMVRFDQLAEFEDSVNAGDWQESVLTISGSPPGGPGDGDRYLVGDSATGDWSGLDDYIVEWSTTSGTWLTTMPNEGMTTFVEDVNKYYLYRDGDWAPMGEGIDHGDLIGLGDDDHTQYSLVDGSRAFTSTVGGVTPVAGTDLTTKQYVDDAITSISGGTSNHGSLTGLDDDDHTHYTLADGTRAFSGTVSGIDPTEDAHLTTKNYVDGEITSVTNLIPTDHDELNGLGDDDHTQYILVDGTRGFTGTVSGIDPTVDEHLTTKQYVDDAITTATGSLTSDHGDLTGLGDDDHPHYILEDGSREFSGTVSGVYPIEDDHLTTKEYVDEVTSTSGTQKWGRIVCIDTARNQAVTFDNPFPDDQYTVVATLTNEVDATPSIYSTIQGVKTAGGFTTHFSGKIDSSNFILEWIAFYGQQH